MRRLLLASIVVALLVSACSPTAGGSDFDDPTAEPTTAPDQPVSSDDTPVPTDVPEPPSGDQVHGEASVDSVDILILESFPVQVHVVVRGTIGDSCTERDEIMTTREGDTFQIRLTTTRDAGAICDQLAKGFEETIPLDVVGLPAGTYTVDANGVIGTFTLDMDNSPIEDQILSEYAYGLANVTSAEVYVKSQPTSVEIFITGWLPNPCVEIHHITEALSGSTITLTVETRTDPNMMCIQVIEDFSITHPLTQSLASGHYTLKVNDYTTEFDIP